MTNTFQNKDLPVFRAPINAIIDVSTTAPSKSKQTKSMKRHHTNLSGYMQRSCKSMHPECSIISAMSWVSTCAWSLGGPGLNLGEQRGGSSRFGIKKPLFGLSGLGLQSSYIKIIL